jgi:SHS2 domain-containing protein
MENAQHETCDDTTTVKNLSTEQGYEYLDHTADVQLHAWGTSLSQCLAQLIRCMFGYMTNIDLVDVDEETSQHVGENVIAQGHDWYSLIFAFMDEWLFVFHDTGLLVTELEIVSINRETFSISSKGKGEKIDLRKHTQGTEIKAITYSNMEMQEHENRCDIWVIVDI